MELDTTDLDPFQRQQVEMLGQMLSAMETPAVVFFRDLLNAELESRDDYEPVSEETRGH